MPLQPPPVRWWFFLFCRQAFYVLALGLHFLKTNWVMMRWIILGELSGPGGFLPIRCKLKADLGASSIARRTSVRCALSRGKGAVASRGLPFQALANT